MTLQQRKKRLNQKCVFCGTTDKAILDCHRIIPGSKYTAWGTVVSCSNCHRRVHDGQIEILGKYNSTGGVIINYKEDEIEKWSYE